MTPLRHFLVALLLLLTLTVVGVIGYVKFEGYSVREAIHVTVITLSTVGYSAVQPLTPTGEWLTIVFIMFGFAVAGITAFVVQGELHTPSPPRL